MKSLPFIPILILTLCGCAFAQSDKISPCPTIEVKTPGDGYTRQGEKVTFTANVSGFDWEKLKYNWKFSKDIIVEGQGSPVVSFTTTKDMHGLDVNPTVEIEGLPENCANKISGSYQILFNPGSPLNLDDYTKIPISEEKLRLNEVVRRIKKDFKDSKALFFIYFKDQESKQTIKNRVLRILNHLSQKHQLPKERFNFILAVADENRTRINLVPTELDVINKSWEEQLEELKSRK